MDYSRLKLPWHRVEKGQGFFIPALDLAAMREYVLRRAVMASVYDARAEYGILDGVIGVWFFRLPDKTSAPADSAPPESGQSPDPSAP